jgi:hypothetical protein
MLTKEQIQASADWIASHQSPDGALPWWRGGKMDPWDHVHSAMGLTVAGRIDEAKRAYRYLEATQTAAGGWYAWRDGGKVTNRTQETNHAAYPATGIWQLYLATSDEAFLSEMWPMVARAMRFVTDLQADDGTISWAINKDGKPWNAPLLTGCSSTHGSLVCAIRMAERLGHERPEWYDARERLARAVGEQPALFFEADLPERVGRFSMDWYYPVLGGALRGKAARDHLLDPERVEQYMIEGVGCRCVDDNPWYTLAETCEFVLALDAAGLSTRAQEVLGWSAQFRKEHGGYWTGKTWPENVHWPLEDNTWTAAAVLLANDALGRKTVTSELFRSLAGDDLAAEDRAVGS